MYTKLLVECATLWGEHERVHVLNVVECDCMSIAQPQAPEMISHQKYTLYAGLVLRHLPHWHRTSGVLKYIYWCPVRFYTVWKLIPYINCVPPTQLFPLLLRGKNCVPPYTQYVPLLLIKRGKTVWEVYSFFP